MENLEFSANIPVISFPTMSLLDGKQGKLKKKNIRTKATNVNMCFSILSTILPNTPTCHESGKELQTLIRKADRY